MISDDARDPLATTIHGRTVRRGSDFIRPEQVDLASLRVAYHARLRLCADRARNRRGAGREDRSLPRRLRRRRGARPGLRGRRRDVEVLRSLGNLANHLQNVRDAAGGRRPERDAGTSRRGCATRPRTCRVHRARQTALLPALAGVLRGLRPYPLAVDHRLAAPVDRALSGRDRRQTHPDLLPLARARLRRDAGGPPGDLAAGRPRPRTACRSACRSSARAAAMRWVLAAAAALEALLAGDPAHRAAGVRIWPG